MQFTVKLSRCRHIHLFNVLILLISSHISMSELLQLKSLHLSFGNEKKQHKKPRKSLSIIVETRASCMS